MPRDYKVYLEDILAAIDKIQEYTRRINQASFAADAKTFDAVIRNLEVIGEAAKQIPNEIRVQLKSVPWKEISGMRDVLIHQYFGVEDETLWDIIQNELPTLKEHILHFIAE